jgi:hypothetical protein
MVQPLAARFIPADFLTTNHYIFGQLRVTHTGIIGMLTDQTTSVIEINDASITRIHKPDKVINYASEMWLVKRQILAVCLTKREFVTSQLRPQFSRPYPYNVEITTPVYEIKGVLEWPGRFKFSSLLSEGSTFFMLQDAQIDAILFPALHIASPYMMVNRDYMDSLLIVKKKTTAELPSIE